MNIGQAPNTLLDEYPEMKQAEVGHCLKENYNCYGSKDKSSIHWSLEH